MLTIKKLDKKVIAIIFNTKEEMFDYIERILLLDFYEYENNKTLDIKPSLNELQIWYKKQISKFSVSIKDDIWTAICYPRESIFTKEQLIDFKFQDKKLNDLLILLDNYFTSKKYSIIFANKEDKELIETIHHEIAHCLWEYNPEYKKEIKQAIKNINPNVKNKMTNLLLAVGYNKIVLNNELQAYLTTSPGLLAPIHGTKKYNNIFKKIIKKYYPLKKIIKELK